MHTVVPKKKNEVFFKTFRVNACLFLWNRLYGPDNPSFLSSNIRRINPNIGSRQSKRERFSQFNMWFHATFIHTLLSWTPCAFGWKLVYRASLIRTVTPFPSQGDLCGVLWCFCSASHPHALVYFSRTVRAPGPAGPSLWKCLPIELCCQPSSKP